VDDDDGISECAADGAGAACYDPGVDDVVTLFAAPGLLLPWLVLGFLAGSIPFGLLVTRALGHPDVRRAGSGNIGATNVARVAGRKLGVLTLVLDVLKGLVPVFVVARVVEDVVAGTAAAQWRGGLVALAAVVGHCFTPWLAFRGGKGVATALGVLLALDPALAGAGILGFGVAFAATRVVSFASLTAVVIVAVALFALAAPAGHAVPLAACLVVVVVRHVDNIRRLARRQEPRL
jgi:glycerol-3-phosphate acyltransferase PlsY